MRSIGLNQKPRDAMKLPSDTTGCKRQRARLGIAVLKRKFDLGAGRNELDNVHKPRPIESLALDRRSAEYLLPQACQTNLVHRERISRRSVPASCPSLSFGNTNFACEHLVASGNLSRGGRRIRRYECNLVLKAVGNADFVRSHRRAGRHAAESYSSASTTCGFTRIFTSLVFAIVRRTLQRQLDVAPGDGRTAQIVRQRFAVPGFRRTRSLAELLSVDLFDHIAGRNSGRWPPASRLAPK